MEITEVRIKLMEGSEDRLRAFCSVTFDHCFVVRDLKIIDGVNGPFVAMPSRKLTGHCPRCGHKNYLRAQFCNQCGVKVRGSDDASHDSPQKLYADVAHPINSECREMIQKAVIDELEEELARAGEPGYRSRYDDEFSVSELSNELVADSPVREQTVREQTVREQAESRSSPPPPHFNRVRNDDNVKRSGPAADEDGFGAGIFDN